MMEQMMSRMMEMISECRQVLEELKETKAPKHDADGDSDESD